MLKHRVCIEKDSLIVGGNLNNPSYSGLSCWNGNNSSSNANWNIVSRPNLCHRISFAMVFFAENKESLHNLKKEIVSYLNAELNLELKENHQIFMVRERGLDYLGHRFFCNYILMRKNIAKKFRQVLTAPVFSIKEVGSITSYYGWAMWADSYNFLKKHLYPILPQIRRACAIAKVKNPFRDFYFVIKERKMITPTLF